LHDEKRGGIVFDSGSIKVDRSGLIASLPLNNFHNTDFKIIASLRVDPKLIDPNNPDETDMITFTKDGNDARFILRDNDDKHDYALLKEL
jgi:ABC-2 type transport system ATP-binding protein